MITKDTAIELGLSYDDVLLIPRRTSARSRKLVDVSSQLTPRIRLHWPIVSANVPFCTEAPMAIRMAQLGAIGFVHRMNTPEQEAEEVRKTKTAEVFADENPHATVDEHGRLRVGAGVGVRGDYLRRAELLVAAGVDILVVDIAHGHADYALETIERFKQLYPEVEVVAGNVGTGDGARELIDAGADCVKVGIGPGAICITRQVAGAGVPQITAIINAVHEARKAGIPVIADGGIRHSGDITKALAAGASTVMLGSGLAGTDESSALLMERNGRKYKVTTGFVTLGVELTLKHLSQEAVTEADLKQYVPEGVEATYEYEGSVEGKLLQLVGGLRSGISYGGGLSVDELQEKAGFYRVTEGGRSESRAHARDGDTDQVHPDYQEVFAGTGAGDRAGG